MGNDYEIPRTGALKLKKLDPSIKKKKKKKVEVPETSKKDLASHSSHKNEQQDIDAAIEAKMRERNPLVNKTKAELRFLRMQEKMKEQRIMEKASKSHKMRVEDFNRHLDNLTEHFDIPKVSWTK